MPCIETDVSDGIATLTLSRPERKNALNPAMQGELDAALQQLRADARVRALVITGAGTDFCSGGDISAMQDGQDRDAEAARARMLAQHGTYQRLLEFDRPVIAAVDGVAFGAGFSYAIAADIVIASDRARFCLSFAKVGLVPDLGLMHTLPRLIGLSRARDLIYTAREIGAQEAHDLGLVHEVTTAASVAPRAQQIARAMAHVSPSAFAMTKSILARTFELEMNALLDAEASAQSIAFGSDYVKESIGRFMRREPARFSWPGTP